MGVVNILGVFCFRNTWGSNIYTRLFLFKNYTEDKPTAPISHPHTPLPRLARLTHLFGITAKPGAKVAMHLSKRVYQSDHGGCLKFRAKVNTKVNTPLNNILAS